MKIESTEIEDTFAEGFTMRFTRVLVTALDGYWLDAGLREFCGYGTSVIGCDAEIGIESRLSPDKTPDQRVGVAVLAFAFSSDALQRAIMTRTGQCLMTCPTAALFDGLPDADKRLDIGNSLRYFGDGYQKSKLLGERRYWRIPVMEGEFIVEATVGAGKGVAGGNFLIQSESQITGLDAARRAVSAIDQLPDVITPFPGGVVRSGSKVGSRYSKLRASTFDAFCPTLRGRVGSRLVDGANCVYEIVIDGVDFGSVQTAMRKGIEASIGEGVLAISAGNYGGELGKHHFRLFDLFD